MKTNVTLPVEEKQTKSKHIDSSGNLSNGCPFEKAKASDRKLKLLLWGPSGAGKTTLALHFKDPVVIDTEGGTELYDGAFRFEVLRTTSFDEVTRAVDWLLVNRHSYKTFIIDPITVIWEDLVHKWSDIFLRRSKGSKGYKYEFFELSPKEWLTIKAEWRALIRKLIMIDMNVIVTARVKTKYKDGGFMVTEGETFDAEKSLPYMFDVILKMYVDEKEHHMASCVKDRSNRLPKEPFECSYSVLEKLFGKENLNRASNPIEYADEKQKAKIREYIEKFKLTPEQVERRLSAYDAESLDDLTSQNAQVIISKFESAIAAKGNDGQERKEKDNAED